MMRQATSKMRGIRIALASCCLETELFSLFALGLQRGQDHERRGVRPFKPKTLHFHRVYSPIQSTRLGPFRERRINMPTQITLLVPSAAA